MDERSQILLVTTIGAVVGALAGFLLFTDRGRSLMNDLEPAIEDMGRELSRFRQTVRKAVGVAGEGWRLMNETMADSTTSSGGRYADPHQTTPF